MKRRLVRTEADNGRAFHKRFRADCAKLHEDVYDTLTDDAWTCVATWLVHIDRLALKLVCKRSAERDKAYTCGIPAALAKLRAESPCSLLHGAVRAFLCQELHGINELDKAAFALNPWGIKEVIFTLEANRSALPERRPRDFRLTLGYRAGCWRLLTGGGGFRTDVFPESQAYFTAASVNRALAHVVDRYHKHPDAEPATIYKKLFEEMHTEVMSVWKPTPMHHPAHVALDAWKAAVARYTVLGEQCTATHGDELRVAIAEYEASGTTCAALHDKAYSFFSLHRNEENNRARDLMIRWEHVDFKASLAAIGLEHHYLPLAFERNIHTMMELASTSLEASGLTQAEKMAANRRYVAETVRVDTCPRCLSIVNVGLQEPTFLNPACICSRCMTVCDVSLPHAEKV